MELLVDDSGRVKFEPDEALLFSFLLKRCSLGTARVDYVRAIQRLLLVTMQMPSAEQLESLRDRRGLYVSLLSKVAFKTLDRVVGQKNLHLRSEEHTSELQS